LSWRLPLRFYRDDYGFVDDYVPVDDERKLEEIQTLLADDLLAGADNVDIFIPDDLITLDDERAIQYILFPGDRLIASSRTTLTIDSLRPMIERGKFDLDSTLRFADSTMTLVAEATIYECLAADVSIDDRRYLLSDGDCFLVDGEFLERVNQSIEELRVSMLALPCYRGGAEAIWNAQVAKSHPREFICMDGWLVHLPGDDRVIGSWSGAPSASSGEHLPVGAPRVC